MDPVTVIVSAVAAGASAGLKDAAAASIKDAYAALKRLISDRYGAVDVAPVEKRPDSEAKRRSLEEDLKGAGADSDDEILEAARRVIEEVREHEPAAGAAIGIDLERVQAANLRARRVQATGTGVRLRESTFSGDIELEDIRAWHAEAPDRP